MRIAKTSAIDTNAMSRAIHAILREEPRTVRRVAAVVASPFRIAGAIS